MKVDGKDYRTVWMRDGVIYLINQLLLPHSFDIFISRDHSETATAIRNMVVRGAPAIGATAAYGLAQAILKFTDKISLEDTIEAAERELKNTRPTAVEINRAIDYVKKATLKERKIEDARRVAVESANRYADLSVEVCKKIGKIGEYLVECGSGILTHCNAGALACVDYGTALAPLRLAHDKGRKFFVYVSETRPRNQGSLTAWELSQEGIEHALIVDDATGYFMRKGKINMVIVGVDRIAMNGDVANKIGTFEKAVLADAHKIPFYVAAPLVTIDRNARTGDDIPIEERAQEEVLCAYGVDDGAFHNISLAPKNARAFNPAFDITPAKYITRIITEAGIIKPNRESIEKVLSPS